MGMGIMSYCEILDSCYFYKHELSGIPCTYKHMVDKYCRGDYKKCARFIYAKAHGRNNVPLEMFPNDSFEPPTCNIFNPDGGVALHLKVLYPDGTSGIIKASILEGLIKTGKIVAFHCSEGWVEVRRKQKSKNYLGPERRKSNFVHA
jgi:hypothetical protein